MKHIKKNFSRAGQLSPRIFPFSIFCRRFEKGKGANWGDGVNSNLFAIKKNQLRPFLTKSSSSTQISTIPLQLSRAAGTTLAQKSAVQLDPNNLVKKQILNVKINALVSLSNGHNLGLVELSNGYTIIVSKAKLNEQFKVQVQQIHAQTPKYATVKILERYSAFSVLGGESWGGFSTPHPPQLSPPVFPSEEGKKQSGQKKDKQQFDPPALLRADQNPVINCVINQTGPKNSGIAEYSLKSLKYPIIVPKTKVSDNVQVKLMKFKQNYGIGVLCNKQNSFAQISRVSKLAIENRSLHSTFNIVLPESPWCILQTKLGVKPTSLILKEKERFGSFEPAGLVKASSKEFKHVIIKLNVGNPHIVLVKLGLGVKPGDLVQIQIQQSNSLFSTAKIIKIICRSFHRKGVVTHPLPTKAVALPIPGSGKQNYGLFPAFSVLGGEKSAPLGGECQEGRQLSYKMNPPPYMNSINKKLLIKQSLKKMLVNGVHFGEQPYKCHANMRKFIWLQEGPVQPIVANRTNSINSLKHAIDRSVEFNLNQDQTTPAPLPVVGKTIPELGRDLNPPFFRYPFVPSERKKAVSTYKLMSKKKTNSIINIFKTRRCLNKALNQLAKYAAKGRTFLFVGTKKPAATLIARAAILSKTSLFVNKRWLGGMLTNCKTILKSIWQIRPILLEKQRIIKNILEKRKKIQHRLIQKVNLLRKTSRRIIVKAIRAIKLLGIYQTVGSETAHNAHDTFTSLPVEDKVGVNNQMSFTAAGNSSNSFTTFCSALFLKKSQLIEKSKKLIQKYKKIQSNCGRNSHQMISLNLSKQKLSNKLIKQIELKKRLLIQLQTYRKKFVHAAKNTKQLFLINSLLHSSGTGSSIKQEFYSQKGTQIFNQMIAYSIYAVKQTGGLTGSLSQTDLPLSLLDTNLESGNSRPPSSTLSLAGSGQLAPNAVANSNNSKNLINQFVTKFTDFIPFINNYLKLLALKIQNIQKKYIQINHQLKHITFQFEQLNNLTTQLNVQINSLNKKVHLQLEFIQSTLNELKVPMQTIVLEQRLFKILPDLRYLPTSKTKMLEIIQILMKKVVDPKLSYSMDQIYDDRLKFSSKKIAAARKQKWQRLEKYFGGITKIAKMMTHKINVQNLSKTIAIIVGQKEEINAVQECRKLGMKIFSIIDTNCNPKLVDHPIPANDDSRNGIKLILNQMLTYIILGQKLRMRVVMS